jgi:hypothetical protein
MTQLKRWQWLTLMTLCAQSYQKVDTSSPRTRRAEAPSPFYGSQRLPWLEKDEANRARSQRCTRWRQWTEMRQLRLSAVCSSSSRVQGGFQHSHTHTEWDWFQALVRIMGREPTNRELVDSMRHQNSKSLPAVGRGRGLCLRVFERRRTSAQRC